MASRRRSVPTPSTSAVYSARSNDTWVFGFICLLFYNCYRNFAIIICFEHFQIITSVRLIEAWPWKQPWHGTERPSCIFLSVWLCWWCARGSCRQSGPRSGGSSSPGKSLSVKKMSTNKKMTTIFNRRIKYSRCWELCLRWKLWKFPLSLSPP